MNNYPTYKLGEIIDKVPIEFKVKQKEYLPKGKFPVVDQGQDLVGGFVDDESLLVKTELPVIVFGDHTKAKKFIDFPFVAGADGTIIIKPKKEFFIEPKLFYWFLHCVKFPDKGYARHFQYLLKSNIAVPPLPTQRAIVTRIESLFAELNKGVEHLRTAQQQLKTYRQAVLNHSFSNETWKNVSITDIIEKEKNSLKAGPFGSSLKKEYYVEDGYKVYGQEQVISGDPFIGNYYIDEDKYKELESCKIKSGDVLISLVGTVGKILILPENIKPGIINPRLIKITLNRQMYDSKFFKYYFESSQVKSFYKINASGTTMDVLNIGIIKQIPFPLPPLPEQQRIVAEIESRLSQAEAAEANIEKSLQQAEALRQSILKKAFSGELV